MGEVIGLILGKNPGTICLQAPRTTRARRQRRKRDQNLKPNNYLDGSYIFSVTVRDSANVVQDHHIALAMPPSELKLSEAKVSFEITSSFIAPPLSRFKRARYPRRQLPHFLEAGAYECAILN